VRKLVVLDRDGVINADSEHYIKSAQEWQPLPGSLEAIARLCQSGYQVIVASNQSGLGRGLFDAEALAAIHAKMRDAVIAKGGKIDAVYYCPHTPQDHCDCRKPLPGLLRQIEKDLGISLKGVPAIGDSSRDLAAARAVGARPILVLTGNGRKTHESEVAPVEVFEDLAAATGFLLSES
jgi:D-glycero-D-manno-heptose 1,7-bisphosphate phosphatase